MRSEDTVRNEAARILGLADNESGQITHFSSLLGIKCAKAPDGWHLPEDPKDIAVILEAKREDVDIDGECEAKNQLFGYVDIARKAKGYDHIVGILTNGAEVRVFYDGEEDLSGSRKIEKLSYYYEYFKNDLDITEVQDIVAKINRLLHYDIGIPKLEDRMVYTAAALAAQKICENETITTVAGNFNTLRKWVAGTLRDYSKIATNMNLNSLINQYEGISAGAAIAPNSVNVFAEHIARIAELMRNNKNGSEDIFAVCFNEFNRYRAKNEAGQVFTPYHITSLMYRLCDVHAENHVLDATCGSGTFLSTAMSKMAQEAGGLETAEGERIRREGVYGIEKFANVFGLACCNMIVHGDGHSHLKMMDTTSEEAGNQIKEWKIDRVLMNPPYERGNKCVPIITNVLNNVQPGAICGFLLPDYKLDKDKGSKLLKKHTLKTIIKLPENTFHQVGVSVSLFIFEAGHPQNGRKIHGWNITDDGLCTVKNRGRRDVHNAWQNIEDYWVECIKELRDDDMHSHQIIDPAERLSYAVPVVEQELSIEDFNIVAMDYICYKAGVNPKDIANNIGLTNLYSHAEDNQSD